MRTVLAVALLLNGAAACTSAGNRATPSDSVAALAPAAAPTSAADTTRRPASLVRRLAEAADGYRDGTERYVVAAWEPPHNVLGAFLTEAAADSIATARSSGSIHYKAFGPYVTPRDPVHEKARLEKPLEEIVSVTVTTKGGKVKTYSADSVDALFWSLAAFDKFVAPYLTSVSGVEYAAQQREKYRRGNSLLAHSYEIPHYRTSF